MRMFKTGSTTILEDESTREASIDEVREVLALQYPEVRNATLRRRTEEHDEHGELEVIEFVPKAGRKG